MVSEESTSSASATPEDQFRAGSYALCAALLRSPLDNDLRARLLAIDAQNTANAGLPGAWAGLRQAAEKVDLAAVDDEFHALFIGIGRGEVVPYGSWYQTGFLMEKPLGELRKDLAALGFERQSSVREPEDHVAALCEVMAMLISDAAGPALQQRFFNRHMGAWIQAFYADLAKAPSAHFYRAVAALGREFFRLESDYLSMPI